MSVISGGTAPNPCKSGGKTDASGVAYVAWTEAVPDSGSAGDDVTHFCRVVPRGRGCAAGSARTFACCINESAAACAPNLSFERRALPAKRGGVAGH